MSSRLLKCGVRGWKELGWLSQVSVLCARVDSNVI